MKRSSIVLAIVLFCVFCFTNLSAAVPNLVGTWSASIKRTTFTGCDSTPLQMVVMEQCNNLFRGVITYRNDNYNFTGEIVWNAELKINEVTIDARYDLDSFNYESITFRARYKSKPEPTIVKSYYFHASIDEASKNGTKYDIFSLTKVN